MSAAETVAPATPAPVKKMSLERIAVRSLIGALLVLLAIEGVSWLRVMAARMTLVTELQKAEQSDHRITRERVDQLLGGRQPLESKTVKVTVGEERYDIYYYPGLLKRRELCVHYGVPGLKSEPEVIEVTTILPDEVLAN